MPKLARNAALVARYVAGASLRECAAEYGIAYHTARRIVWRAGELRQRGRPGERHAERDAGVIECRRRGLSEREVGARYGMTAGNVGKIARRAGVWRQDAGGGEMSELPKAIASATIQIMGISLTCHVLDDGSRVFAAEGVNRFIQAMADGAPLTREEAAQLADMVRGSTRMFGPSGP